eukprot:scaffold23749_cov27-Phaeocystis_antarctica.AAC.1
MQRVQWCCCCGCCGCCCCGCGCCCCCGGVRGAARTVDDLRLPRLGQDLVLRQPAVLDDTLGLP